ncbi:Uncharacterized protein PIL02S_03304 [Paenibacillus illinoisensis]|uniref:Uncharacterized protein n=1 Tax=Paenibacillus illinoisensis TaxID=59845 RepID=A0A2W0CK10_9BACL|nr:Uncharacterized protein PIL02S_03304 [Paenibacillus illinoisensis]
MVFHMVESQYIEDVLGTELIVNEKKYKITSLDSNGRIDGLRRFNEKTKMWVSLKFLNDVNIDELDNKVATLLGNKNHYIFR